MMANTLIVIIGTFFSLHLGIALSKKVWCTNTKEIATKECNSCLCIDGVPVCTKLDCSKIPKEQWASLLLKKRSNRTLLALGGAFGIGFSFYISIRIFIQVCLMLIG